MRFDIMTLFPEMVMNGLETSIIGRAVKNKILEIEAWNIRDYAFNKHSSVDDYPYGGGAGMLMQAEPVYQCYDALARQITERKAKATEEKLASGEKKEMSGEQKRTRVIYLSPQGKTFNQSMAEEFAQEEDLVFLCGHYEGIDERVLEEIVTDYVSIGDYVLTGGELPAMIMIDAISRLVPGVLHNDVSAEFESFQDNLLEYPQYSRPEVWHDRKVPEILMSGHFKQFVILKFKGIDNINDIERYKRCPLLVERKDAVELEEDEYFIADMIGIEVVTEDDKPFGTLKDVMETGANDVYVIDTDEHGEVLVPAIRECILDVDIENQKMKIHLMDGLI